MTVNLNPEKSNLILIMSKEKLEVDRRTVRISSLKDKIGLCGPTNFQLRFMTYCLIIFFLADLNKLVQVYQTTYTKCSRAIHYHL
jgi:hypothetical protein